MGKAIRSLLSFNKTETFVLLILIAYCIFVSVVNPNFLGVANIFELLRSSSWIWILGLGAFMVLLSGGFDVSFTSIAIASGYISVIMVRNTGIENLVFVFFIAMIVGALFGAINGLVIHFFKLPTLIATLGTKTIFIGLMAVMVGVEAINTADMPEFFKTFGLRHVFTIQSETGARYGFSVFIIPLVILVIITWFILYRTLIGRGIVALGNSEEAARLAGFNLFKIRMFVYMYAGILAAIAGVIAISEVAWIAPLSSTIIGMELTIVAAVIIGGTSLGGGKGTIFGAIIGILLVRLFETTLVFIGINASWFNFFVGLVLLLVLAVTSIQNYRTRRRMLLY
ncbi:ABC transporter permease [Atribacter laminatus]|uniref:Ribose import permease protein RbsC n=1 Tax=Atribacter laminatus TaxID=2847778 RepID=A0A7T1F252_ATRLM|nr:ABC transporter permease [Atribacter laminatus]QPM67440.1 Ribose import permease protein RbsC [Atribacter laminatus]